MYGLVNRAIEQMVVKLKGEEAWQEIRRRAGVGEEGFVAMCPYHDDVTYRLVGAVSEFMNMPAEQVLEAFGAYWVLYTVDEGYAELMESGGASLREFLSNLDDMHGRVETVFPHMVLPRFSVRVLEPDRFELRYVSERAGLAPMVKGLIMGLAQRFEQRVEVSQVAHRATGANEDVFVVRELASESA